MTSVDARLAASLAVLALLVSGCTRGGPPAPRGTVEGTALMGPTCPVEREPPESGCEDQPYAGELEAVPAGSGHATARFSSGDDGRFEVPLPPGDYTLRSPTAMPPTCSSPPFTVAAGQTVHVDVSCDTGIR